jgi:hypothetical protein
MNVTDVYVQVMISDVPALSLENHDVTRRFRVWGSGFGVQGFGFRV